MYRHTRIYTQTYIYIHIHMCVCIYIYIYIYIIYLCIYKHACRFGITFLSVRGTVSPFEPLRAPAHLSRYPAWHAPEGASNKVTESAQHA